MTRDELGQGLGIGLATRNLQSFRQALCFVEHLVRNRNSGFHTVGITGGIRAIQARLVELRPLLTFHANLSSSDRVSIGKARTRLLHRPRWRKRWGQNR